jgi:hypothetical protein
MKPLRISVKLNRYEKKLTEPQIVAKVRQHFLKK